MSPFEIYLRTGRIIVPEIKFNPWHDVENGRFTFRDTGKRWGPAAKASKEEEPVMYRGNVAKVAGLAVSAVAVAVADSTAAEPAAPGTRPSRHRRKRGQNRLLCPREPLRLVLKPRRDRSLPSERTATPIKSTTGKDTQRKRHLAKRT